MKNTLIATCESALITIEYIIEQLGELCDGCGDLFLEDVKTLEVEVDRLKKAIRAEIGVSRYECSPESTESHSSGLKLQEQFESSLEKIRVTFKNDFDVGERVVMEARQSRRRREIHAGVPVGEQTHGIPATYRMELPSKVSGNEGNQDLQSKRYSMSS